MSMYVRIAGGGGDDDCKTDVCCKIGREEGSRAEQSRGRKEGKGFCTWSLELCLLACYYLPAPSSLPRTVSQSVSQSIQLEARQGQGRVE